MGLLKLDTWPTGQLQDMLALLQHADSAGIKDIDILRREIVGRIHGARRAANAGKYKKPRPDRRRGLIYGPMPCSACGRMTATAERINVCKSTNIGGPWRSAISCINPGCRHIEYSVRSVADLAGGGR